MRYACEITSKIRHDTCTNMVGWEGSICFNTFYNIRKPTFCKLPFKKANFPIHLFSTSSNPFDPSYFQLQVNTAIACSRPTGTVSATSPFSVFVVRACSEMYVLFVLRTAGQEYHGGEDSCHLLISLRGPTPAIKRTETLCDQLGEQAILPSRALLSLFAFSLILTILRGTLYIAT